MFVFAFVGGILRALFGLRTLENQLVKVFFFKTRHDKMSKKSNAKRVYFQV